MYALLFATYNKVSDDLNHKLNIITKNT